MLAKNLNKLTQINVIEANSKDLCLKTQHELVPSLMNFRGRRKQLGEGEWRQSLSPSSGR